MESVIRGAVIYVFCMIIFRIAGRRSLTEITTFDFVLLLIISETTQQAMLDNDHSLTNTMLLIITLVGLDVGLSLLKGKSRLLQRITDSVPLIILENGQPLLERMNKARVDINDIMSAARASHGLCRLNQIQYAVLERSGGITVIPKPDSHLC